MKSHLQTRIVYSLISKSETTVMGCLECHNVQVYEGVWNGWQYQKLSLDL